MIELKPKFCQTPDPTYSVRNQAGLIRKFTGSPPILTMRSLTRPWFMLKKLLIIPTSTTVEMKCGR